MNNSFGRLVDGMSATLREQVLPNLQDDFARGQVFGVIYMLNNLKARGDWSVGFLADELAAQHAAFTDLARLAESVGVPAPWAARPPPPPAATAAALVELRNEGDRALSEALAWLAANRERIPMEVAREMEGAIRRAARTEIEVEMKHLARPMFAEISEGRE